MAGMAYQIGHGLKNRVDKPPLEEPLNEEIGKVDKSTSERNQLSRLASMS